MKQLARGRKEGFEATTCASGSRDSLTRIMLWCRTVQIKEEEEEGEEHSPGPGHLDQDLRHIYARSNVTQDSVKALIAMHKNLPDEVRVALCWWAELEAMVVHRLTGQSSQVTGSQRMSIRHVCVCGQN